MSTIKARAVLFDTRRPGHLEIREFEVPSQAAPGQVLVRIHLAGICGSDVHTLQDGADYGTVIPGHEMVGEVVSHDPSAVDAKGHRLRVGDRVVPESTLPCLHCPACRGFPSRPGRLVDYSSCDEYQLWGAIPLADPVWLNGGYAEYLQVPANGLLHRIDDHVTDEEAVLLEPLSVGVKAVFKAGVTIGDIVVIEGPGPIGLTCVIAAREAGAAEIIVTGAKHDASRLLLAMELGATGIIDITEADPLERLLELTGGRRADRVIDATGAPPAFDMGLKLTARSGVYTCVGGEPAGTKLPVPEEYCRRNKIDIQFSHLGTNCYQPAYEIIRKHRYPLHKLVTHRWPLAQAQSAFESLIRRSGEPVKAVLEC